MYINGELQDFPTLKDFTKDKFIGGNLYEYYKEFFERLEFVDHIIDTLFNENFYNITYVSPNIYDDIWLEKMKMIASTVYYRMKNEHKVYVDIRITYGCLEPYKIDYQISYTQEQYNNINYYKEQDPNRRSGRTTRNINQYIQFAYQKWLSEDNIPIDLIDHFSFEIRNYDRNFIGRSISGPNNANHALVIRLKNRIYEEFPESILKFVQLTQYKLSYNLPKMKSIDYTKIE